MKNLPINVDLVMDAYQLVRSVANLDYSDCIEFIMHVDLVQADVGFTEQLIKILVESMKKELDHGLSVEELDLPFIDWSKA